MPTIASLAIDFTTNVASITNDMSKIQRSVTGTLQTIKNVAATAFATFIPVATINQALNMAGALQDLSQQTDFAAESLQAYRAIAGQNSVDTDKFDGAITKLSVSIGQAREGSKGMQQDFARVGITLNDLATMTPEQIFQKMQDGFAKIGDQATRASTAAGIFGKQAGPGMAVFMSQGSAAIAAQRAELEKLGAFMSNDLVAAAAQADDELAMVGNTMQSAFNAGFLGQISDNFHLIGDSLTTATSLSRDLGEVFGFVASEAIQMGADVLGVVNAVFEWAGGMETVKTVTVTAVSVMKLALLGLQDILVTYTGGLFKMLADLDRAITELMNKLPEKFGGGSFTPSDFLRDMAEGSAHASADIRAEMEKIAREADTAGAKWQTFMKGGKTPELARELDILGTSTKNLAQSSTDLVKVPVPGHIEKIGSSAKKAKTEFDKLGDSIGDALKGITDDALRGELSLKSLGDAAMKIISQMLQSNGAQEGITNFFSSAFSGIGSFFSNLFGGLPSFDVGTNRVERTGLAMIHKGEEIRPASAQRGWSGGDGSMVVNINNYGGANVQAKQSRKGGLMTLDIEIDRVMANKLRDPGSYSGGVAGLNGLTKRG